MRHPNAKEIIKFVQANAATMKDQDLCDAINRLDLTEPVKLSTVRKVRVDLGIQKSRGRGVCRLRGESANKVVLDNVDTNPEPPTENLNFETLEDNTNEVSDETEAEVEEAFGNF